ncbi:heme-binding protein [Agromyces sp. SYSU K20354]|uniref:GlcG/HbpS family heme-binding protein n=1 Tax=Agromyces cavernae TaxID=2898659 RepID=UPI001E375F12|nr:heme-binding protein [Agromyces cavernae]MCD2443283.1 heme-binding protein [Agromyces cavernae]
MPEPVELRAAVSIGLDLAVELVGAARRRAEELGVAVSIAVVDAGGHLIGFARMDGAEIAGPTLAVDKAFTAVAHRAPTSELGGLAVPGGVLFGLHANGGGRYVLFPGGMPLAVEGVVVGGVGVSGADAADDEACARVAVELFASRG